MIPVLGGDVREAKRELESYVSRMSHMLETEGWKHYEAYLKGEENRALLDLQRAVTSDMAMKASSAYLTIKSMREYPLRTVEQAVLTLQEMGKK